MCVVYIFDKIIFPLLYCYDEMKKPPSPDPIDMLAAMIIIQHSTECEMKHGHHQYSNLYRASRSIGIYAVRDIIYSRIKYAVQRTTATARQRDASINNAPRQTTLLSACNITHYTRHNGIHDFTLGPFRSDPWSLLISAIRSKAPA